ncbi:EF-hand domain pair domain-containing protein [Ditylenchus destructor]|nr:EF-hand domain pair domain-containing protein [Ditylenchus destructor]
MIRLRNRINTKLLTGIRYISFHRQIPEHRKGLRSIEDLKAEEEEMKSNKPEDMSKYNMFGGKKWTPKDSLFYTDRKAGTGYSSYANTSFQSRPYIWPPMRRKINIILGAMVVMGSLFFIDFEWFAWHIDEYIKKLKSEAATLKTGESQKAFGDDHSAENNQKDDSCSVLNADEGAKKKKKKIGFRERRIMEYENRIRSYSTPDKIFRYFATLKVTYDDGSFEIFMNPEDFVRSLTPGVMQPRNLGLDKFKNFDPSQKKVEYSDKDTIFYWVGEGGLISFGDYLFLMTLLSTPPSEFRLAFHVYDLNGDGELDEFEFSKVQELVLKQSNVGQRHRDHVTGTGSFRAKKSSAITKYFFGPDGKDKLNIEKFLKFQHDLHRDILKIEFERRDPESNPVGIISEISFAELLLLHANLPTKKEKRMMKRVRRKFKNRPGKKGVSFQEVNDFFSFLYSIDKVDMALHFYKLAGKPLSEELIKKLARKVTGVQISDTVVEVLIALFDENGDGELSQKEFITVMKRRMQRGLEKPKDTGLIRTMDAFFECSKKQSRNLHSIVRGRAVEVMREPSRGLLARLARKWLISHLKASIVFPDQPSTSSLLLTQKRGHSTMPENKASPAISDSGNLLIKFDHGLPTLSVPLPSRKENCQFILRPISDTVGTFCDNLIKEDNGIEIVALYNTDSTRISKSTNIQHLLRFEKFRLRINDSYYEVSLPLEKNDYLIGHTYKPLESEERMAILDDLKAKISSLHALLNVDDFKVEREKLLLKKLEEVEIELRPMEIVRKSIEEECHQYR